MTRTTITHRERRQLLVIGILMPVLTPMMSLVFHTIILRGSADLSLAKLWSDVTSGILAGALLLACALVARAK